MVAYDVFSLLLAMQNEDSEESKIETWHPVSLSTYRSSHKFEICSFKDVRFVSFYNY